ncbi:MAG: hypothetical protein ABSC76_03460 [Terracidiphilus sp.]|jgi:hypothetical protein
MKLRNMLLSSSLIIGLAVGGVTLAQNVSPARHPNLAAAQELIDRAFEKVTAAQEANEFDMGGHAAKAKELLMQAREEIKKAARDANHHDR